MYKGRDTLRAVLLGAGITDECMCQCVNAGKLEIQQIDLDFGIQMLKKKLQKKRKRKKKKKEEILGLEGVQAQGRQ